MNASQVRDLVSQFVGSYDAVTADKIWQKQSTDFRRFWSERVLAPGKETISDDDCDAIIRILDRNGKGNTKESHAVAKAMVSQNVWRKLFNILHTDKKLAGLVDLVFKENNVDRKTKLIDELYVANTGGKNWLTGESGNVLNALLAAHDPFENLSVVSLKHRKSQMDFFGVELPFEWESGSYGKRIAHSNKLIREGARVYGLDGSARTVSIFFYFEPVMNLWQSEDTIKRTDKKVVVTVPQNVEVEKHEVSNDGELRESLQMQATLAEIGSRMGFQIWLPRADRGRVLTKWKPDNGVLLENLPVGFDQTTMKTIEQIDVLWLKKRTIARAFEVEHTTSIYSGILRMADLLAMQPNLKIKLHIVAPASRREKVFQEIRRPVFALLEGGSLSDIKEKHLEHLSDEVIEEYEDKSQEA